MKKDKGGMASLTKGLRSLGYSSYQDYLKSDHWREVKKKWFWSKSFKGMKCSAVGCNEVYGLDLHHRHYCNLGKEQNGDLVLVCRSHHEKIHEYERRGMRLVKATHEVLEGG